ncbi:hypothetical protein [Streptomyces sp. ISL-86]|uniref:hypothetical protein n=1 Tax=Streptomyces sp. ISL-86 TaxID=2819187 RepID=UPI0027E44A03|nr:hypothetical protein [Streptomyces sp. ISL-86]
MEAEVVKYTLSEQQADLLHKIAAASGALTIAPSRSNTAWALRQRGLIKQSGQAAVVTSEGRYFLKHGKHPKEVQAEKERLAGDAERAARAPADGVELISRLQAATHGQLTVSDPGPRTRGRWRAAYYDALHHGRVPGGYKIRWAGRQHGDCVFALVDEEAEQAAQPQPVPAIEIPDMVDRPHLLVRATRKAIGRSKSDVDTRETAGVIPLHVSREQADRALLIMHALLTEVERRGYQVDARTDLQRGQAVHEVVVAIRGHDFPLTLTERRAKVLHKPTPQEIRREQHSPWTRIPKYDHEFNGRLELGAPAGSRYKHVYTYSDSARWTLESRLGHLLRDLEEHVMAAERRQQKEDLQKAEQRRRWYATVAQAREQQIDRHRTTFLVEQVQAWRQADAIDAFCRAAHARADGVGSSEEELQWLQWAEEYAERIDPLRSPLRAPPDPPSSREALQEFLKGDLDSYPWPFDSRGRWSPPDEDVSPV